jgi:hypothetical protein
MQTVRIHATTAFEREKRILFLAGRNVLGDVGLAKITPCFENSNRSCSET